MEIEIAVRKYEVPHRFSSETLAQAAALPTDPPADRRHRIDLTDVPLVTIDGEDARDFDDAGVLRAGQDRPRKRRPTAGACWSPSPTSATTSEAGRAARRGRLRARHQVYFPRRVIPMLPEKLSNGLCSLNPDVERLAMVSATC